ncbi:MAG: hypothetical protein MUQ65_17690 [Armatimonadetes bacterium]|nr:hypothetical protein [Armatimonadota bacterium]
MMGNRGKAIQRWREAMAAWRETGDASGLAEVAAAMDPMWRRAFLDSILPTGLRHDLESLLGNRSPELTRRRTAA